MAIFNDTNNKHRHFHGSTALTELDNVSFAIVHCSAIKCRDHAVKLFYIRFISLGINSQATRGKL